MELLERLRAVLLSVNRVTLVSIAAGIVLLVWILWPRVEPEEVSFVESDNYDVQQSQISIHVVGEVINPGLYELPIGSRVSDLVDIAGGVSENASMSSVNLARILVDGEQVIVKSLVEFQQELDSKISINDASVDQLDEIPGVGPSIASKIIDHRERNGPFRSLQQLTEVSGVGPKMFENIKDLIRL
jgi:comEA protein